jgi:hypothetical protein
MIGGSVTFSFLAELVLKGNLFARNLQVKILQVVLARTTDFNYLRKHSDDNSRT